MESININERINRRESGANFFFSSSSLFPYSIYIKQPTAYSSSTTIDAYMPIYTPGLLGVYILHRR